MEVVGRVRDRSLQVPSSLRRVHLALLRLREVGLSLAFTAGERSATSKINMQFGE